MRIPDLMVIKIAHIEYCYLESAVLNNGYEVEKCRM